MKTIKQWSWYGLAAVLAMTLSGCVWLRLLETKNQLADFDENFRVQVTDNHFLLNFLEPVMLSEDFVELTKLNPSRVEPLPKGYRWFVEFRSEPVSPRQPVRSIVFALTFTDEHRLVAWDFSPLFLEIAPPAFLEASLRSLGKGQVDQGKRQLKVESEDLPKVAAHLPSREKILEILGPPSNRFTKNGLPVYQYRFKAETQAVKPDYEDRRLAEAKLYFDPATDRLARMSGRFAGLKLAIDYRKLAGEDGPVARAE
jgi:hypothetical protein